MLKKLLLSAVIFTAVLLMGADPDSTMQQYYGKSVGEFSGLSEGGVKPTQAWLEDRIFTPLKVFADKIQWEDTLGAVRYVDKYDDIMGAIFDGESTPQPGRIIGPANETITLLDTAIYLTSNTMLDFSPGMRINWQRRDVANASCRAQMIVSNNDSNIVIRGGEIYGYADVARASATVVSSTDSTVIVTGITVAADSLVRWTIITAVDTFNYRTESNTLTTAGQTTIEIEATWDANPSNGQVITMSPQDQYQHGIQTVQSKRVWIKDMYIHDMPGDGINILDGSCVTISGCEIDVPLVYRYVKGVHSTQVGRQGITLGANATGSSYGTCTPFEDSFLADGYQSKIKIMNNTIKGGLPGAINLEPNAAVTFEDIEITNNILEANYTSIAMPGNTSTYRRILIADNIIRDSYRAVTCNFTSGTSENITFRGNTVRFRESGMYLLGPQDYHIDNNVFIANDSTASFGIQIGDTSAKNIWITNCTFINMPREAIYVIGARSVYIENCTFINPGYKAVDQLARYAIQALDCNRLYIRNNKFISKSPDSYFYRAGRIDDCDSVFVYNNIVIGAEISGFRMIGTTNYDVHDNTYGLAGAEDSEGLSGGLGGEKVSRTAVTSDTMVVDSSRIYIVSSFNSLGTDSVIYGLTAGTLDTLLFVSDSTVSFRAYNDSIWIHSSDYVNKDSISVRLALFGERINQGATTLGDTTLNIGDVASETWYTFPGHRNSINSLDPIGAALKAQNISNYTDAASQQTKVSLWTNPDDGLITSEVDLVRGYEVAGGKFYPENLVVPATTYAQYEDSTHQITPVTGMMILRNDSLYVYTGAAWHHWVAAGTGVDPTNNE